MRRLLLPREWGPLRYSELWQEGEELLYVHSSRFSDKYSRYRIRDIQAFVLTEFPLWNGWRAAWLGSSLFFTAILAVFPPRWWKLFALFPGVFLIWAIGYLLRGPRCRLVLHTAVSTVTVEAVRTMAQAREVVPELRRLAEEAQGRLAADGMTVMEMPHTPEPPRAPLNTPLLMHLFFGVLLLHALVLAGFYFGDKMDSGLGVSGMLLVAEVVMGGLAAVRWRSIGAVMTAASLLVALLALADGGFLAYAAVKSMGGFVEAVSQRGARPEDMEWLWLKEQTVGRAAWHAVAGLLGWAGLLLTRRSEP
jgi:hypothetical protein